MHRRDSLIALRLFRTSEYTNFSIRRTSLQDISFLETLCFRCIQSYCNSVFFRKKTYEKVNAHMTKELCSFLFLHAVKKKDKAMFDLTITEQEYCGIIFSYTPFYSQGLHSYRHSSLLPLSPKKNPSLCRYW